MAGPDRVDEPVLAHELADRRALAAGDDQGVDRLQVPHRAHLGRDRAETLHHEPVLAEVALQREHAHMGMLAAGGAQPELGREDRVPALLQAGTGHVVPGPQPRNWSFSSSGIFAASMPAIASPSPTETSASTAGSL